MPIYTYACRACGAELERRQSFSDAPLTVCESCGSALYRVLHPVGVIFKGSGFYNTDYKKTTGNGATASSDTSKDSSTPSESKTSESKKSDGAATTSKSESASKTPATTAKE